MNDLNVTVTGWVATEPKQHTNPGGATLTTFRLATTSRYFDRSTNTWVDRDTEWFTVRTFRSTAANVAQSVRKGQPVIVMGRLHTNEWGADDGPRVDVVIDATTVGHDLARGAASFIRAIADADEAPLTDADLATATN